MEAERLSVTIINRLGRFERSGDIPEETIIKIVMNDGLRSRIQKVESEEEQAEAVHDAYLEELQAQGNHDKKKLNELTRVVEEQKRTIEKQEKDSVVLVGDIRNLKKERDEQSQRVELAAQETSRIAEDYSILKMRLDDLETDSERRQQESNSRRSLGVYATFFVVIVTVSTIIGGAVFVALPPIDYFIAPFVVSILIGLCVFIMSHLILEARVANGSFLRSLWLFGQVKRLRRWLWTAVTVVSFGVVVNLVSDQIGAWLGIAG